MIIINELKKVVPNHIELIEQNLAKQYVNPDDKVLELGARYGAVSVTTNQILNDEAKKSHYVVEPDRKVWDCLEHNMKANNCEFNIIKGVIGKKKYKLAGSDYSTHTVEDSNSDIQSYPLPLVNFNTLIVDCEGYFERFYDENPKLFHRESKLEKIIVEADMPHICDYPRVFKLLQEQGYQQVEYIKLPNLSHHVFIKSKQDHPVPKVLLCSLSDRPTFSGPMFLQMKKYCDKHGYKCVLENNVLCSDRAQSWSKILLLQREMKNNPDVEILVWVDDDIILTNHERKIEDIVSENPFSSIMVSDEPEGPFNCGLLIIKNDPEGTTYNHLQHIWDVCESTYPQYKTSPNWEQEVFWKEYKKFPGMINIVPYKTIQTFYRPRNPDWTKGDFSAHMCGIHDMTKRMEMRDDILKQINVLQQ